MFNEIQVAKIYEKTGRLSDYKNWILAIQSISQQYCTAKNAEIPESGRDYALFLLLADQPLHKKSTEKACLSDKTDDEPDC